MITRTILQKSNLAGWNIPGFNPSIHVLPFFLPRKNDIPATLISWRHTCDRGWQGSIVPNPRPIAPASSLDACGIRHGSPHEGCPKIGLRNRSFTTKISGTICWFYREPTCTYYLDSHRKLASRGFVQNSCFASLKIATHRIGRHKNDDFPVKMTTHMLTHVDVCGFWPSDCGTSSRNPRWLDLASLRSFSFCFIPARSHDLKEEQPEQPGNHTTEISLGLFLVGISTNQISNWCFLKDIPLYHWFHYKNWY